MLFKYFHLGLLRLPIVIVLVHICICIIVVCPKEKKMNLNKKGKEIPHAFFIFRKTKGSGITLKFLLSSFCIHEN